MTNFLISIIVAIGLVSLTGWGAIELFQGARDGYDQQMTQLRLEQVGAAVKSKIKIIDGLPALPAPIITSDGYPAVPSWISANARDIHGNAFVYCPYALRPVNNMEGTAGTVTGPGYNIVTYASSLFGTNSPNYVIGSDKPALYATAPAASITPGAASGYGVTFTASSGIFTAQNVGQMMTSGGAAAVITGFTDASHVVATITQNFPSTSAIASGNWQLSSAAPKGLLGLIIAFKPHDIYDASAAQAWCNSVAITAAGNYSTVGTSANGLVYPIIAGQSQYQQAYAKSDNVTYYAAPSAVGDATGRNPSNASTIQAIFAQLAVLHPARATIYLAAGTHNLLAASYNINYDPGNLRGMIMTLEGVGNNTILKINTYHGSDIVTSQFGLPSINTIFKNLTLSNDGTASIFSTDSNGKWIFENTAINLPVFMSNNVWLRGTNSINTNDFFISDNAKVFIDGATTITGAAGAITLKGGELNILPGASLSFNATTNQWSNGVTEPALLVTNASKLNVSGTLNITSSGVQMHGGLGVEAGGFINLNNATLNIGSGSSTVAGMPGRNVNGAILVAGDMNINNSSILFPNGVAIGVAGIDLVDGGKFTMHNGSVIGSSTAAAHRPYYGIYDDGGSFVGGSSTGYSSGGYGEGGSPQSHIYVQTAAGAMCWSGQPWPQAPASGSSQQQRHLFWDSNEGNGNRSTPRGTNNNAFQTASSTSLTLSTGSTITLTVGTSLTLPIGDEVVIASRANTSNNMAGYIASYNAGSGALAVNVTSKNGAGTFADWNVAGGLDMRHLVLANQTDWLCHSANTITAPTPFTFASKSSCAAATTYNSETLLPTGYNTTSSISVSDPAGSNPQYSLNGGSTWHTSGTIVPGNTLTLAATTLASGAAAPTVTIGGVSATWNLCQGSIVNGNQVGGATNSATSLTVNFTNPTTLNDLVVVTIAAHGNPGVMLTDNLASTYTPINSLTGGDVQLWSYDLPRVRAGVTSITANFNITTDAVMIISEYSIINTAPLDRAPAVVSGSASSIVTPSQAVELVLGYNATYSAAGAPTISASYPATDFKTISNSNVTLGQSDVLIGAIANQQANYTDTGTASDTGIATFKSP